MIDRKLPSKNFYKIFKSFAKRASVFISNRRVQRRIKQKKASITIEAAMAVPLFLLAMISLLYLMELTAVQTAVRSGMQYAGKELAKEAYLAPVVIPSKVESDLVKAIGADRLNGSIVIGGSGGIQCQESRMSAVTGICELVAVYEVRIPIPVFSIRPIKYKQEMRIKSWRGYVKGGFGNQEEETVYVTETGLVYHKNYKCTYLDLSIGAAASEDVGGMRNVDGEKYKPCERCAHGSSQQVYITDTGNRYHGSIGCSGLKRTIYAVPVSEAVGKGACSRCGT